MVSEQDMSNLFTQIWQSGSNSCSWDTTCQGSYANVDPKEEKIKELEKKIEEVDVINKPGVRWLQKQKPQ